MVHKYRYLPHTADIAFIGYGRDFKEALESAAIALLGIRTDIKRLAKAKGAVKSISVREHADDEHDLVWFTLQKILSTVDAKQLYGYAFRVKGIKKSSTGLSINGVILYKSAAGDYTLTDVKAVTPHDLWIKRGKGRTSVHVLVDI